MPIIAPEIIKVITNMFIPAHRKARKYFLNRSEGASTAPRQEAIIRIKSNAQKVKIKKNSNEIGMPNRMIGLKS
jgi:hypothetical protein